MEGFLSMKMKRKSIGEANDEFSDFSLCSPAMKIRRLDAELPSILEEESEIPMRFESSVPEKQNFRSSRLGGLKIEEIQGENEERAIVLVNPEDTPLRRLHSNFSLSVDPHILSGIKNQVRWSNESSPWRLANDEEQPRNSNSCSNNGCLAVVPWVPSPLPLLGAEAEAESESPAEMDNSDAMDADKPDEATMDVEDCMAIDQAYVNQPGTAGHSHQWQHQHCFDPQPLHNSMTPITWYR